MGTKINIETQNKQDLSIDTNLTDISPKNKTHDSQLQEIVNYLIKSDAHFKSQQRGEPELSDNEKRNIALNIFSKSPTLFLSRFGFILRKDDLSFFSNLQNQDYEIKHYIAKLQRYFNKPLRQIDIRNRRYHALKTLIKEGDYFSETQMMKRNPLLYEQLIGQYMSEDQKRSRDYENVESKTLSGMLLECFDRRIMKDLQDLQQDAEDCAREEEDSDEDEEDEKDSEEYSDNERIYEKENERVMNISLWGEKYDNEKDDKESKVTMPSKTSQLTEEELNVLKQEFVTHMYQNFLDGKDDDFDYSTVDNNETYDNINERSQDEEDKYFDSEEPADVLPENTESVGDSEDELEMYMRTLQESQNVYETSKDYTNKRNSEYD